MKNGNRNVKLHVNGNVTHKGNGSWIRLENRKGWLTGEGSSDEKRSCNRKEIVWANWKKNEPARESNVNVTELVEVSGVDVHLPVSARDLFL